MILSIIAFDWVCKLDKLFTEHVIQELFQSLVLLSGGTCIIIRVGTNKALLGISWGLAKFFDIRVPLRHCLAIFVFDVIIRWC